METISRVANQESMHALQQLRPAWRTNIHTGLRELQRGGGAGRRRTGFAETVSTINVQSIGGEQFGSAFKVALSEKGARSGPRKSNQMDKICRLKLPGGGSFVVPVCVIFEFELTKFVSGVSICLK